MNLNVIWRFLLGVGELTHISVCKKETATIMLKTLGATVQNLVARVLSQFYCRVSDEHSKTSASKRH